MGGDLLLCNKQALTWTMQLLSCPISLYQTTTLSLKVLAKQAAKKKTKQKKLLNHKYPKHSHQEVRDKSDNSYHPKRRNHVTKVSMFLNLYHGVGGGKKMNEKKSRLKGSTSKTEDQVMRFIPHIGKLLKNCLSRNGINQGVLGSFDFGLKPQNKNI